MLVRVLEREGLSGAWVGLSPVGVAARSGAGQRGALRRARAVSRRFVPRPSCGRIGRRWERALRDVVEQGAAAVRAYPMHWGMGPHDPSMRALALACGELGVPLLLTVRFEDLRQRSPLDVAGDLTAAHVRALARADASVRLVVVGAGRELLEETHWGLTPEEQGRVHWDFAWIWGPPEDHFAHLLRTVGAERFVYGTHWPLRLTQNPRANLDLLPPDLFGVGITDASTLASGVVRKAPT